MIQYQTVQTTNELLNLLSDHKKEYAYIHFLTTDRPSTPNNLLFVLRDRAYGYKKIFVESIFTKRIEEMVFDKVIVIIHNRHGYNPENLEFKFAQQLQQVQKNSSPQTKIFLMGTTKYGYR